MSLGRNKTDNKSNEKKNKIIGMFLFRRFFPIFDTQLSTRNAEITDSSLDLDQHNYTFQFIWRRLVGKTWFKMRELYKSNFDYYKNQTSAFKQNYNNSIKHFPNFPKFFIKFHRFCWIKKPIARLFFCNVKIFSIIPEFVFPLQLNHSP